MYSSVSSSYLLLINKENVSVECCQSNYSIYFMEKHITTQLSDVYILTVVDKLTNSLKLAKQ